MEGVTVVVVDLASSSSYFNYNNLLLDYLLMAPPYVLVLKSSRVFGYASKDFKRPAIASKDISIRLSALNRRNVDIIKDNIGIIMPAKQKQELFLTGNREK